MDNIKPRQPVWITEPTYIGSGIGWIAENDTVHHKVLVEYKGHNNVNRTKIIEHARLTPFGY